MPSVGVRYFVAVHPGDIEALRVTRCVQHGVVARALRAESKIIAHEHVACTQAVDQYIINKALRRLGGQCGVKGQHHGLVNAAGR